MKIVKDFLRQLMLLYKRLMYLVAKLIVKVDNHTVIFESFQGRSVACNPKAIFQEMEQNPEYDQYSLIWSLRKTDRTDLGRAKIVKFESFKYYKALAQAKYWVFNSNTRPFLWPRKNQVFIQTWHGTPLKKIGCDVAHGGNALTKLSEIENIYNREAAKISYMISPSAYCTEKFVSAFNLVEANKVDKVLTTGYPRNDFLFKATTDLCNEIKNQMDIPKDKKVILYAPTFRDNKYSAKEGYKLEQYVDFQQLKEQLGDEYVILFRAHYFISSRIDLSSYKGFVYDVSDVEDINSLYVISDLLITDYSSVFFDYANLKRPILFYMNDYDEYKNQVRDFYLEVDQLPGPIVENQEDLVEEIKKLSSDFKPDDSYIKFNNKFNYLDSKDCSLRVIKKIIN